MKISTDTVDSSHAQQTTIRGRAEVMDKYTKIMLTVIAVALCALVGQNMVHPVKAQQESGAQRVVICSDTTGEKCGIPVPVQICNSSFSECVDVKKINNDTFLFTVDGNK
jgi:hypothetical protein